MTSACPLGSPGGTPLWSHLQNPFRHISHVGGVLPTRTQRLMRIISLVPMVMMIPELSNRLLRMFQDRTAGVKVVAPMFSFLCPCAHDSGGSRLSVDD